MVPFIWYSVLPTAGRLSVLVRYLSQRLYPGSVRDGSGTAWPQFLWTYIRGNGLVACRGGRLPVNLTQHYFLMTVISLANVRHAESLVWLCLRHHNWVPQPPTATKASVAFPILSRLFMDHPYFSLSFLFINNRWHTHRWHQCMATRNTGGSTW